ncbi:MBL fold metallo-hydrolase [Streptomyces cucumeris]|uniref:MBL fold metallo-hydrolase n=1 Tax=Streptomyces cucumeris TaxID=2962890 RepID=UPI003D72B068
MTTTVTLTGTGVPYPEPGRAGAGTLVRHGDIALQFDAGRATTLRLAEAGLRPYELSAVFVTHVHSDHVVDLPDLTMVRWVQSAVFPAGPLPVLAPAGEAISFLNRMLDPYTGDIEVRMAHVQSETPSAAITSFRVPATPQEVWRSADGSVTVTAVGVHHEPVKEAVAYRIDTPDGAVVVSGDTRVCAEVEDLCRGAQVLVHEACRITALEEAIRGSVFEKIFDYHADTVALGAMAKRAGVPHTVLTHLIPAPSTPEDEAAFEQDLREGGYEGKVSVGRDLMGFELTGE